MNMLKNIRKERGLTLEQAAILANIPKSLLSQIEGGYRTITLEKADKLSKIYKVPLENIFEPVRFSRKVLNIKENT